MSNEENNKDTKLIQETKETQDSLRNNTINETSSENIIQEIKTNNEYIITKNSEKIIPQLLIYLQNNSNQVSNKLEILKYIEDLFTKVNFNSEIFLQKSKKLELNIYQVIINQYVTNHEENKEYLLELEQLFVLLLSQITLDRETYHYLFSFIINYINKCNNNIENNNIFNSEQLSRILLLLQLYYQSVQRVDEPYNYFYFNGDPDTYINIDLKNNFNYNQKYSNYQEINILFFIKLLPNNIVQNINPEIPYKILDVYIDKENNKQKNIIINIDKNNFLSTNYTSKNLIKLPENKMISFLVKLNLKELTKTEIYIDNEKIEIPKEIIIQDKDNKLNTSQNKIKKIKFFQNFIGICSNIIIYKENEKEKKGLPKFFISSINNEKRNNIRQAFACGIYKEDLFNILLKADLKDNVDNNSYKQIKININEKIEENDINNIKDFLENYLISIYIPNRYMSLENNENKKILILKDSINAIDGEFYTESPKLNGVHIFKRFSEDFEFFGGLNHFLPIIEIMTENNDLLANENLSKYFSSISSIFMLFYHHALKNENNSNFFFNLSYFLEKIPDKYFDEELCSKLISISRSLLFFQNDYINIIRQFHNDILMNKIIFFKFNIKEQNSILLQIKLLLEMIKNEGFIFDIMNLINIMLTYDEDRYNKFCCKFHSEYFNIEYDIYNPELNEILKPIDEIISKLFEIFIREAGKSEGKQCESGKMLFKLFEMLTLDISPCLQKMIIKHFLNFLKNHLGKYYPFLDTNNRMFDIILFLFKTSIFDIKIDSLNLILLMNKLNKYNDSTNETRTKSWAFLNEKIEIDNEKSIFIQNYILPFYLLTKDIPDSNNNKDEGDIIKSKKIETIIIKKNDKEIEEVKFKKLKKNNFYKINKDGMSKSMTYSNDMGQINSKQNIHQNGVWYNYIKISPEQQKVNHLYKKEKMNLMKLDLYNNSIKIFKEPEYYDFVLNLLIKIVSKSDINLISNFLEDLKMKLNNEKMMNNIYKNELLFKWLLETSFQSFMIKESNFDENKFKPGLIINDNILSEEEKKIKIEKIYSDTKEFILNIIRKDIYQKLDYLFSWSKYYYELRKYKNNFQNIKNFIFNIIRNIFNSIIKVSFSEKENSIQNEYMYYLSLLFEFFTFYNFSTESKESDTISRELYQNFPSILLLELRNINEEKDLNLMLNIKWIYYPFYQTIFIYFKPIWSELVDKKKKNERDNIHLLKKYIGKKNSFLNEIRLLFHSYENLEKTEKDNKSIKNIFLIFHFFILLFSIVEDKDEIKSYYNDFYLFICLLIISSSTLTISENKKQKWLNEATYYDLQDTVELILYFTLKYYKDKILEVHSNIKKYVEKKDDSKIKYYNFFFQILIESLGNIIKLLALIYNEHSENRSKILSKIKSTELMTKTGPFILIKNIYTLLESKDDIEKEENCINNILKINIKNDTKESNSELEKNIYNFIKNTSIQNFILKTLEDPRNKKKLYPFEKIMRQRRNFAKNMIPLYNNKLNLEEIQANICLVPDYWQECIYNKILEKKIGTINNEFITEIFLSKKKMNLEMSKKINEYKKIKKKLFTFKGIWSKEEFFYESKYHIKYKLLNHYTQDFAKILLTPILDLDYYLPVFSEFQSQNLFRSPENQTPIYYLVDLSFTLLNSPKIFNPNKDNQKNKENNTNNRKTSLKTKRNALFDLKLINYSFNDVPTQTISFTDTTLFYEYITKEHLINSTKYDIKIDTCLVKPELHICGIFYNNLNEIGFYSSDRTPNDQEEYDTTRQVCFGSVLKPQMNKYNYYYIKISYHEIDFVLKRKYYYKKTCLEIYTINKKSYFFRFSEDNLKKIYENIRHYMKNDIEDILIEYSRYDEKIGFFNKNKFIKKSDFYKDTFISISNNIKNMNLKYIYDKWIKWEISTLNLLSYLNLYSNRSFNDINQYPVFPWISLDYELDSISYQDIRPFGTPMGMLDFNKGSSDRKESFLENWEISVDENDDELGSYRSHYSTSLYITYYLVRVFPFSSMRIELQGKNFDDPHRLFNSIKDSFWCATTQRADLRELIPEFFYFPEMFYNVNKFDLGEIKDKVTNISKKVNDIKMPLWADNDGYIFINKHRMLLESPEVNEKINEWFNLIFGIKRKGKDTKKIHNLFLECTYDEEFEEKYNEGDEKTRIYYCRMVEFGITPHQIFKNETNKRLGYNELKNKKDMFINMTEILKKNEETNIEIINELQLNEDNIFIPYKLFINQNGEDEDKKKLFVLDNSNNIIKILKIEQVQKKLTNNNTTEKASLKKYLQLIDNKNNIKLYIPKNRLNNTIGNTPTLIYNKGHCIIMGGFWNGSILVENIIIDKKEKGEKIESKLYLTKDNSPITHILIDENETFILCGNIIGTIYIYIIDSIEKNILHLYKILYDNYSPISSLDFNDKLNICITCFKDGICNLYITPQFKLVNSFKLKNIINNENCLYSNISLISSSPLPCFIFYFKQRSSLCVCSINGHFIKEQKIDYEIKNQNYIKKFTDNQFIDYLMILDDKNCAINIYNIIDLQIVMKANLSSYYLIDFIFSKDFDNLFILVNEKEKKEEYKILIMKNKKILKINQEIEKKITNPVNEEEIKKE